MAGKAGSAEGAPPVLAGAGTRHARQVPCRVSAARIHHAGSPGESANWNAEAHQPSWSSMRRALASIRFSPADNPRLASRSARSRTTSTTRTRSPDASFSRFALYRRDQLLSPPLSTTAHPSRSSGPQGTVPREQARSQDDSDRTYCHAAMRVAHHEHGPELDVLCAAHGAPMERLAATESAICSSGCSPTVTWCSDRWV